MRGASYGGPGSIELTALRVGGADALEKVEPAETWVRVPLARPVSPGGSVEIGAEWVARLPPIFARTGWLGSFHLVAQWFPKLPVLSAGGEWLLRERHANSEFLADHVDYDVALDVPAGWRVGACGEEATATEGAGGGAARERHRFTVRRAVDFAWTAWDGFDEFREEVDGIGVRWLYPAAAGRTLARQRRALAAALPRFRRWFGPLPYGRLTVVLVPPGADGAGGMEYPGFVTTTSSPAFAGPGVEWAGYRDDQEVVIHELAHQWFYALVATDEAREPWLDEALATWVTGAAMDDIFGADRSSVSAGPVGIGYLATRRACWRLVDSRVPSDRSAEAFPSFDDYAAGVYCRGALALDALALAAGRERVLRGLGRYAAEHRFARASAAELYAALEREAGPDPVARVFRPAMEQPAAFDLVLESVEVRRAASDAELIAPRTSPGARWVTTVVVRRKGASIEVPVEVEFRFPGASRRGRWDGSGAAVRFAVQSDRPPTSVLLDPDRRVLLDRNLLDNGWRASDPSWVEGVGDETFAAFGGLLEVLF
ncbi:MAG: hypothetical protein HY907_00655 [Deltaproteobacteria bacterium]|nr:hypothetical protein [Deltaproteobacteria bacterium]